ncbi:hypothetical protein GJAV_G00030490 [Gymnothorax javanicus]|nr:hypothetical protein GJAV_G00030490 [Gymnothorax javanicus]
MSQPEIEMPGNRSSRTRRRRLWRRLGQRWKLLGLFEIDQKHEFFDLTQMMKEGLSAAVQNTIDNAPPEELTEDDFKMEVTQVHQGFQLETFAGPVFASLRHSLGMTEQDYQHSLSSEGCYLQFISNSKSKADFFLTHDKRFFLKTQSKREAKFLLSNLKIYLAHLEKYPHSLLVKFLGVHRIRIPHQGKKFFIVMQSVFYPDERIAARFDIKGCQVSRWTNPTPKGNQVIVILKDMNFEGKCICLEEQTSWLVRQMKIDTAFLQRLNVLDYSFLVAHQPLQSDEQDESHSLATLIMRTKKSVDPGSSPTDAGVPSVPGTVLEEDSALLESKLDNGSDSFRVTEMHSDEGLIPLQELQAEAANTSMASELQEFQAQNRRLLPNFKNPLHVIDGPELRYFVGIIDIFTVYGFKKKLEHLWKSLRYRGQAFSTVSPPVYARRLCQWVQDHTK